MRNWCECHAIKPFNSFVNCAGRNFDERLSDLYVVGPNDWTTNEKNKVVPDGCAVF